MTEENNDYKILYYIYPKEDIYENIKYDEDTGLPKSYDGLVFVADFLYPVFEQTSRTVIVFDASRFDEVDGDNRFRSHSGFKRKEFEEWVEKDTRIVRIERDEIDKLLASKEVAE